MRVLMKADPSRRESLQAEAEVDPMDGEQTWPTETELLEAEGAETESTHNSILRRYNWSDDEKIWFSVRVEASLVLGQ